MYEWIAHFVQDCLDVSNVLNGSIAASWMVLSVILLRGLLKKAPKWIHVLLWGLVAIRLLFPFSIESVFSLIPSAETLPTEQFRYGGDMRRAAAHLDIVSNPLFSSDVVVEIGRTVDRVEIHLIHLTFIWLIGMGILFLYTAISYWRLYRKVFAAIRLKENIFQSEHVKTLFVLGIIRPRIYLPFKLDGRDLEHVVAHEQAHISRKDHWWKPLGFLLLTIHWFNPLMWLAYVLFCRDVELACDEKVIKKLNQEQRADYTQALVSCSVNRRSIKACPLAFGEVSVKERVKSIMRYKKPAFWLVAAGVIACVVAAVCFLTNPKESDGWEYVEDTYHVIENVYEPLWISSLYFPGQNTPYFCFTENYGTKDYKILESKSDTRNWQEVKTEKVEKNQADKREFRCIF